MWLLKGVERQLAGLRAELAAVYRTGLDREHRKVVAVEVSDEIVDAWSRDWSLPVQIRFEWVDGYGWLMRLRNGEQAAVERHAALKAARQ